MSRCEVQEDEATLRRIVAVLNPTWNRHQQPIGFDEARRVVRAINEDPEFDEFGYDKDGFDRNGFDEHGRRWDPGYRMYT